jgi:hypothetical protein
MRRLKPLLLSFALIFFTLIAIPNAQAALTIGSNTGNFQSSTGGGGLTNPACSSNGVLSAIAGQTTNYETTGTNKATITQLSASCATLSSDAQSIASVSDAALGTYGSTTGTSLTAAACGTASGTKVIVGARIYKTSTSAYTGAITLLCGTLPLGGTRTFGSTLGTAVGTYEDIACPIGSVANGLYVNYGGILDKFGIQCAAILTIPQTITASLGATTSTSYPYSQALTMSTSGSNGSGAITYAISGGTATSCALSSSASNATLTAASSGTCTITATIAADTNYVSATSVAVTFTFNQAGQQALTLTSTSGTFGSTLTLTTSGGNGTGTVSYSATNGTTTCTVSLGTLSAASSGTCTVTATKTADVNYTSISSAPTTVTFTQGISTLNLSIPGGAIIFRQAKTLQAVTNDAGKVTFKVNKIIIPGCKNLLANSGNSFTVTCNYRTSVHGAVQISASFTPTNTGYIPTSSTSPIYYTTPRSGTR